MIEIDMLTVENIEERLMFNFTLDGEKRSVDIATTANGWTQVELTQIAKEYGI